MSTTRPSRWPCVSPENWLTAIDDALIRPFPPRRQRHETGISAPDHHELVLQCSEEFWEERTAELFEAAEAEVEKARQELARELTSRWGASTPLDLEPVLKAAMAGLPLPEPLAYLGTCAPDALLWRRPKASRWLALAVLKHDTELPYVLVAIVGDLDELVEFPVT